MSGFSTSTSEEQHAVEREVLRCFGSVLNRSDFSFEKDVKLFREAHVSFLKRGLTDPLRSSFLSLEASQPWLAFWILHALDLLGERVSILRDFADANIFFLSKCQHKSGGFGGGPGQIPHLATTYAAVSALATIGTEEALSVIDREKLYEFLCEMKDTGSGGFRMHSNGEIDVRGTYCAIAVASLVNLLDSFLADGVGEYVRRCQTYEGGIAGEPGMEAHGGYTYCGLAALALLGRVEAFLDTDALLEWLGRRQMPLEGGFQGRANKLVDSCYSFWQGGAIRILQDLLGGEELSSWLLSPGPAQMYLLLACQVPEGGGLRDKPGKHPDFYHTCYALSGLAVTGAVASASASESVQPNNVLFNLVEDRVRFAQNWFNK